MLQSLRPAVPLKPGMNACIHCARPDLAITEFNEFLVPTKTTYVHGGYLLNHWHGEDLLEEDNDLGQLSRYCHGHGALSGDVRLEGPSHADLIRQWNMHNPMLGTPVTWLRSLWNFICGGSSQ